MFYKMPLLIGIAVVVASCGRSATGDLSMTGTTQSQDQPAIEPEAPSVVGTFEKPRTGVKVTSANTVVEPQRQAALPQPPQTTAPVAAAPTQQPATTAKPAGAAQTYVVQAGDTLSVIANNKFDLKVSQVLAANPEIGDRHEIKPGQTLNIPAG